MIALKAPLSKDQSWESVLHTMVAALGALYKRANSPKLSPGVYSFKKVSTSELGSNFLVQVKIPSSNKKKLSPSSPYWITTSEAFIWTGTIAPRMAALSFGFKALNIKLLDILDLIFSIYSLVFSWTGGIYSFYKLNFPKTSAETDYLAPAAMDLFLLTGSSSTKSPSLSDPSLESSLSLFVLLWAPLGPFPSSTFNLSTDCLR